MPYRDMLVWVPLVLGSEEERVLLPSFFLYAQRSVGVTVASILHLFAGVMNEGSC